jgi:hypothetical protein
MSSTTYNFDDTRVFELSADGKKFRTARETTDAMSEAYSHSARWLAIPIARLDCDFFRLRTAGTGDHAVPE